MTSAHGVLRAAGISFDAADRVEAKLAASRSAARKASRKQQQRAVQLLREDANRKKREARAWQRQVEDLYAERRELFEIIDDLTAMLDEADDDLALLTSDAPPELGDEVHRWLTIRHKRYPGVQADIEATIERLKVLVRWTPEEQT